MGAAWLCLCHLSAQVVQVPTSGSSGGTSSGMGGGFSLGGGDGEGGGVPRWRLPVKVSVSVNAGYDDNVNGSSSHPQASTFAGGSIDVSYDFGTMRTRADLNAGTGFSFYNNLASNQYDPNLYFDLSVNHQASLRMTLTANISLRYASQPDFSTSLSATQPNFPTNLSLDRRVGNYFTTSDSLSMTYQWLPRWSTVTSYSFSTVLYDDTAAAGAFNRLDHSFGQSIRFLYLPITTLVVQYRLFRYGL